MHVALDKTISLVSRLQAEFGRVIIGQTRAVNEVLVCVLAVSRRLTAPPGD